MDAIGFLTKPVSVDVLRAAAREVNQVRSATDSSSPTAVVVAKVKKSEPGESRPTDRELEVARKKFDDQA